MEITSESPNMVSRSQAITEMWSAISDCVCLDLNVRSKQNCWNFANIIFLLSIYFLVGSALVQIIIWANADVLSIRYLETNFWYEIYFSTSWFKNVINKMATILSLCKCVPCCPLSVTMLIQSLVCWILEFIDSFIIISKGPWGICSVHKLVDFNFFTVG